MNAAGGTGVRITNPKIATLAPTWRRYRGFSVLFDNPGARAPARMTPLADLPVEDPAQQALYDDLAALVAGADVATMREQHGFCPLPRYSYHVTVCDGPNEQDLAGAHGPAVAAAAALLDDLPHSLDRLSTELTLPHAPRLIAAVAADPVTLVVSDVAIWGHVLAARLAPADAAARVALERVSRARTHLVDELRRELGLRTQAWRPHVSLGYFANRDAARAAQPSLVQWRRALARRPRTAITYRSAAIYGFTDMASFFRAAR